VRTDGVQCVMELPLERLCVWRAQSDRHCSVVWSLAFDWHQYA